MQNHLLALRWMNPNAVVYLREYKGQGCPEVDLELCECATNKQQTRLRGRAQLTKGIKNSVYLCVRACSQGRAKNTPWRLPRDYRKTRSLLRF